MSQITAFKDLRVLDMAWVVAGPLIGRALAINGATVVRVESSTRLDTARMMGPFPDGVANTEKSALFESCNVGKLGLTLDMSTEQGKAIVRELVAWADVVLESFSPGQMASWGLGYDDLRVINPSIIMLSTSLMGQSGPWSGFAGFGNVGAAISGYQALVGWPERLPAGPYGPYTDFVGPRFALLTLLGALDHRRRTGEGCYLDVSQCEAGIQFLAPQIADCAATGRIVETQGNRDPGMAPHGVFRCASVNTQDESWVAISVASDAQWQRLAGIIGGEPLASDPRFDTLTARKHNEQLLEELVAQWTASLTALQVEVTLQHAGIAAHNVASSQDLLEDAQLRHRQHFIELPHELMGTAIVENASYQLSATPPKFERPAPHYRRDNAYVLQTLLEYSQSRITVLEEQGVFK